MKPWHFTKPFTESDALRYGKDTDMHVFATRFQFAMFLDEGYEVVPYGFGRYGLYFKANTYRNHFKTKLAATGTLVELGNLLAERSK